MELFDFFAATVLVGLLYLAAGYSVKGRWGHKIPLNPLKIVVGVSGRASLSNAQVFFFTLVVAWLTLYWVVKTGQLVSLNQSVLMLLGIAAAGTGLGKAVAVSRFRVTGENWAWARHKGWIKKDFTRSPIEPAPKFSDLINSDQGFEIAKFQAVVFSLIVGLSMLLVGATIEDAAKFSDEFVISDTYLALIGLSQGVYVGGKMVGSNLVADLNGKLDKVRDLELKFTTAVANSDEWKKAGAAARNLELAYEKCAATEYTAYLSAVTEAARIAEHMTGVDIESSRLQPELPPRS